MPSQMEQQNQFQRAASTPGRPWRGRWSAADCPSFEQVLKKQAAAHCETDG
jgi:hypothetical protein